MEKPDIFYPRFVRAIFKRGKAEALPMSYIQNQARAVLTPEELDIFNKTMENMVNDGRLARKGEHYALNEDDASSKF